MLIITVTTTSNLPTTNMDKKIDNFFFSNLPSGAISANKDMWER